MTTTFEAPAWQHEVLVCTWCGAAVEVHAFPPIVPAVYRCGDCPQTRPKAAGYVKKKKPPASSPSSAKDSTPSLFEVMEKARSAARAAENRP